MSSSEMRKIITLVEGTIHGHSDAVALARNGWTYDEGLGRWTKEGYPFQVDCHHLESVFVYDMESEDPTDPVGYFDAAVQAIGPIEDEMKNRQATTTEAALTEGTDLHCQNCDENLGKDTENSKRAYCGRCGEYTNNPRGSDD